MSRQVKKQQNDEAAAKAGHDLSAQKLQKFLLESGLAESGQVTVHDNGNYFRVQFYRGFVELAKNLPNCFTTIINCTISQDSSPFDNPRKPVPIYVTLCINTKLNEATYRQLLDYVRNLQGFTFIPPKDAENTRNIKFSLTGNGINFRVAYDQAIILTNLINEEVSNHFERLPSFEEEMFQIKEAVRISEVQRQVAIAPENFPALPRGAERVINFAVRNTSPVASASASLPRLVSARPASPYSNATRSVSPSAAHAVQNATNVSSLVTPLATPLDTPVIDEEGTHEATTIEAVLEKGLEVIGKNIAELRASIVDSNDTIRNIEAKISPIVNDNKAINASIALLTEQKLPGGESSIATLKASIEKNEALLNLFALDNSETFQKLQVKEKRLALYEKINAEHIAHIEALRVINYAAPTGSSWAENEN